MFIFSNGNICTGGIITNAACPPFFFLKKMEMLGRQLIAMMAEFLGGEVTHLDPHPCKR